MCCQNNWWFVIIDNVKNHYRTSLLWALTHSTFYFATGKSVINCFVCKMHLAIWFTLQSFQQQSWNVCNSDPTAWLFLFVCLLLFFVLAAPHSLVCQDNHLHLAFFFKLICRLTVEFLQLTRTEIMYNTFLAFLTNYNQMIGGTHILMMK